MSNAIYSGVPGASLQFVEGLGQIWLIPCDAEIDIAFKIGGQTYPVHPLDTNSADGLTNPDGQTCVGAVRLIFVILIYASSLAPDYSSNLYLLVRPQLTTLSWGLHFVSSVTLDSTVVHTFMIPLYSQLIRQVRNVYLLVNYGDFVDGNVNATASPYVQLLSTTDPTAANADFVNARLNQTNNITAPAQIDEALRAKPRPIDMSENGNNNTSSNVKADFMKEKIPIIIMSSIGGALVLIGLIAVYCSRDRFAKRGGGGSLANTYRSYQRLNVPAPAGNMHQVRGYHGHGGAQMYTTNSWGRR